MSSTSDTNSSDEPTDERLIDALTTREIRRGLVNSDLGVDENASRQEVLAVLSTRSDADQLRADIIKGAKERILEDPHVKPGHVEWGGQGIPVIRDNLNVREAYYYDSYFQYADHTTRVYDIPNLGGVLRDIAETASTTTGAREAFTEHVEDNVLDPAYIQATEEIPAALVGDVDDEFRPRLVEFKDANTIYLEYWKAGKIWSDFDIRTGDYEKIRTLYRAVLRVDLDSGLVETAGDDSGKANDGLVERFLSEFNGSSTARRIYIRGPDIRQAKENLGLMTSLNEFVGDEAKVRLTRNQAGNVEADPAHEQMERERDYSRSNFQVIIGRENDEWELVYPVDIEDALSDEEDISVGDVVSVLERDYEDVEPVTISLDSGKSTFRIQKKALSPSTRRQVFNMLGDELGWIP